MPLMASGLAWLCAMSPMLQAQPRLLADEEMDQVCAKGSAGLSVDPVALNQMVFEFSRQTSLGQVSGSGAISVEAIPNSSGKSQFLLGPPLAVPGGAQPPAGSALAPRAAASAASAGAVPLDAIAIPPTDLQVVNGTVRVRGDLNVTLQTLPSVLSALQQHRLVLPPGFNPLTGAIQGVGGVR